MPHLVFKGLVGKLPTSEFDLVEDGQIIGRLQLRHRPSHADGVPPHMASNVYYEIDPMFRRKGFGTKILRLGLEEAWKIGLRDVIVTCADTNVGSKKIIEANGAVFAGDATILGSGARVLKYVITTKMPG